MAKIHPRAMVTAKARCAIALRVLNTEDKRITPSVMMTRAASWT
jgi:hypothetical protein